MYKRYQIHNKSPPCWEYFILAGKITSPNYPNNYPKTASGTANKTWTLEAEVGCRIKLTFEEFDVEDNSGCKCKHDFVRIYHVIYHEKICGSFKKKKFCGPILPYQPVTFTSVGTIMSVYFEWDHFTKNYTGFMAKWESVNASTYPHILHTTTTTTTTKPGNIQI